MATEASQMPNNLNEDAMQLFILIDYGYLVITYVKL